LREKCNAVFLFAFEQVNGSGGLFSGIYEKVSESFVMFKSIQEDV